MSPVLERSAVVGVALGWAFWAVAGSGDLIYPLTAHGDASTGVARDTTLAPGSCRQCHSEHAVVGTTPNHGLFLPPDNGLCFSCHPDAGAAGIYQGQTAFLATDHWLSGLMLWPGPIPPPRTSGDEGLCLNCHTPHGTADGAGLVPVLSYVREEALCLACHDSTGPAPNDVWQQAHAVNAHPVISVAGTHVVGEGLNPAAFAAGSRHAECTDCHNPHAAQAGAPLLNVSRIGVDNGSTGGVPTYIARPANDVSPPVEYELCFKCHSSWTTLPNGAADLAAELNPNAASFHPVQAPGTNTTAAMAQSLLGGLGSPSLAPSSIIMCSDCHGSDAIDETVTRVSAYTGTVATGPHGSNAGASADFSSAILRARYRVTLKPAAEANDYARSDFALCVICHSPAPFETTSKSARSDTNFPLHGFHLNKLFNEGGQAGSITDPGAGAGNAICAECHYAIHGTEGAPNASDRNNARLVSFSPNVTGPAGTDAPSWQPGTCTMRCHGKRHDPKDY